jgi:hypothetical protein
VERVSSVSLYQKRRSRGETQSAVRVNAVLRDLRLDLGGECGEVWCVLSPL